MKIKYIQYILLTLLTTSLIVACSTSTSTSTVLETPDTEPIIEETQTSELPQSPTQTVLSTTTSPQKSTITVTATPISSPTVEVVARGKTTNPPVPTRVITRTPKPELSSLNNYGAFLYLEDWWTVRLMKPDGSILDWKYVPEHDNGIDPLSRFSWSPDGLFFLYSTSSYPNLYRVDVEKKTVINLTGNGMDAHHAVFSPDGRRIAFVGRSTATNGYPEIFVMNSDGSDITQLTERCGDCRNLDWSADGKWIVYARYTDGSIYAIQSDGGNAKLVTSGGFNTFPDYSPDGQWLAMVRNEYLYVMPATGGSLRLLSTNQDTVRVFTWSADSRYIIFENFGENRRGLWLIDLSNDTLSQIKSGNYFNPSWSPIMKGGDTSQPVESPGEDCTGGWTRLKIGGFAQVIDVVPNRVRSQPSRSAEVIAEIHRGTAYKIVDGPVCQDGLVFWRISDPTLTGWTAEGDLKEYYLEPVEK
jgi:hypothetical protein